MTSIAKGPSARDAKRLIHANPQQGWVDLVLKYGNSFGYQGGLATCDPEVIQTMLMQRSHTQHRSEGYKLMSRLIPGAPGVLFMEGEEWHKHVQAVMPVFTKSTVDSYAGRMHETVVSCLADWKPGDRLPDLFESITQVGLQVVLRIGYGLELSDPLTQQFGEILMTYKRQTMTTRARLDEFGFSIDQLRIIPAFLRERYELKKRIQGLNQVVSQIMQQRQQAGSKGQDWFNLLNKAGFSLPQITDELNHIYGAFNAIDYVITCGLVELSRRPEWAARIRNELNQVLEHRLYPTRADLAHLPDTTNFMKEVFRYYPVAAAVLRRTGEPLAAGKAYLPKNREVMILIQALHFHPDFWDNPASFDPDRWSHPLREPRAYIPFLTGPRQCIGRHLAELHFVITLNALLQRFNVRVLSGNLSILPYLIPRFAGPVAAQLTAHT
ncbi:cytochrome P450 [Spirosoma panaciterrae]|uniref:cytochrome P450 n=1 Tax=Spirosoma panaciterrae TaxID=496058 RepID=UPI000376D520|nr:cytochrome P450 [Spirosoma panaciterrae]